MVAHLPRQLGDKLKYTLLIRQANKVNHPRLHRLLMIWELIELRKLLEIVTKTGALV
jgi:hypothetical protein